MSKQISNIVFTKNRPLQLNGYLESLYKFFPAVLIQTYIIYKPDLFGNEYKQLFKKYPDCIVIEEKDFHSDCVKLINKVNTKYILFGIDDVVYFDKADFGIIDRTFAEHSDDIMGFSLRFSPDTDFLKNSGDEITEIEVANQKVYCLNWKEGKKPNSRYPFELCATVYRTDTVKKIINSSQNNNPIIKGLFSPCSAFIKALSKVICVRAILKSFGYFFSPNTLESWDCRWCQNNADKVPARLYFQKLCASAIQVNMVNTSTKNKSDNYPEYTVEALNEKYKQGYRLDTGFISTNKPPRMHCGKEYFKLLKLTDLSV